MTHIYEANATSKRLKEAMAKQQAELYTWVRDEIWQDAVRRGVQTKSGQVIFNDPRFKEDWWPEDVWKWEPTIHFSKVYKTFWSELKLNMEFVVFLKICVKWCLEHGTTMTRTLKPGSPQ